MTGALDGVKIADFSWVGAGPRATKDLADNGAVVVKIESRKRLDLGRMSPPFKDGKRHPDGSAFFAQTNTSKMSVTLNLGDPRGVAVAKELIAWADVVVENFSKGFLERLGLSFAQMQAIRPDIILVSVSVAGRVGPLSSIRGYGNSAAALSGQAALAGWAGRPPHMPPFAYGDVVSPMFATIGVLAALEHRALTGEGQHIDVSQVEPLMHTLADVFARRALGEAGDGMRSNRAPHAAPHDVFPCRGHDQWCAVVCETDAQWRSLCVAMGRDELALAHPTLADRKAAEDDIAAAVAVWTAGRDKHALAAELMGLGVPAGAVQDGRDVFTDPELLAAGHYVRIDHPVLGRCDMPAPPMLFSKSTVSVGASPLLGEHNHAVLAGLLGMDAAEIDRLQAEGALA